MEVIEQGTPEEATHLAIALQVGEALNKHYPNHPWVVCFQGGALVIRHLEIAGAVAQEIGREGFSALMAPEKLGTYKEITRSAVEFGGMLLELFGLPRGAWDGRPAQVPQQYRYKQQSGWEV